MVYGVCTVRVLIFALAFELLVVGVASVQFAVRSIDSLIGLPTGGQRWLLLPVTLTE